MIGRCMKGWEITDGAVVYTITYQIFNLKQVLAGVSLATARAAERRWNCSSNEIAFMVPTHHPRQR